MKHTISSDRKKRTIHFDETERANLRELESDGKSLQADVDTAKREHFNSVLGSWGIDRPLIDRRNNKTMPLPC